MARLGAPSDSALGGMLGGMLGGKRDKEQRAGAQRQRPQALGRRHRASPEHARPETSCRATLYLDASASARDLQEALGHSSLVMSSRYAHATGKKFEIKLPE